MTSEKTRLDIRVVTDGLAPSRERARALIMGGKVWVNDLRADKPGTRVASGDTIRVKGEDIPYVSRGGLKLEAALNEWRIPVADSVCMDAGASTGGFTDCLLQRGARRVYAVDVGYGQLAWKLRQDPRVIPVERTNIRTLPREKIPESVDIVTIDVSFISLKLVIPAVLPFLKPGGLILPLIKPQFEAGKGRVGKGGVVRDPDLHEEVIASLRVFSEKTGLVWLAVTPSPVLGAKGNREFLARIMKPSELLGK